MSKTARKIFPFLNFYKSESNAYLPSDVAEQIGQKNPVTDLHPLPDLTPEAPKQIGQKKPVTDLTLYPLPDLMPDDGIIPILGELTETRRFPGGKYYGEVDKKGTPIGEGTVVFDGLKIFSRDWPKTDRLRFTCSNGLTFLANCADDLQIIDVLGILAWGKSRINMLEIHKYLLNTKIPRMFYHALDVVDSGWGDSNQYHFDVLRDYTGSVRVITMCHGCIINPFPLKLNKLIRYMNTPNGVCSFYAPEEMVSLMHLFDQDPAAFERRILEITEYYCSNSIKIDQEFPPEFVAKYKNACTGMTSTFNKEFVRGNPVMNRKYTGPGFSPLYMGYQASDGGWKYVNLFAKTEQPFMYLNHVLDLCSKCSECILIETSCAQPCYAEGPSQSDLVSTGGKRLTRKRLKTRKRMKKKQKTVQRNSRKTRN